MRLNVTISSECGGDNGLVLKEPTRKKKKKVTTKLVTTHSKYIYQAISNSA